MKSLLWPILALLVGIGLGVGWNLWKYLPAEERFDFQGRDYTLSQDTEDAAPAPPPAAGAKSPRAVVEGEEEYDFGVMDSHTTGRHTFVIHNAGEGPLTLAKGSTTCKCTLSEMDGKPIPPGESAQVHLEWKPVEYNPGFVQTAEIETNDPQRPKIRLTIRGQVLQALRAVPAEVSLGQFPASEGRNADLRVYAYRQDELQVESLRSEPAETAEFFELAWSPLPATQLPAGEPVRCGVALTVNVKPGLPAGAFSQTIRIRTNVPGAADLEVPVKGSIVGDISFLGSTAFNRETGELRLGLVRSAEGVEMTLQILVKGAYRDQVALRVVEVDPAESLHVEIGPPREVGGGKSRLFPLKLSIPPGSPPVNRLGSEQGPSARVILETQHPDEPRLELIVQYAVEG